MGDGFLAGNEVNLDGPQLAMSTLEKQAQSG
jgi:hypothetical protein